MNRILKAFCAIVLMALPLSVEAQMLTEQNSQVVRHVEKNADIVVCGGGLAGVCAAVSAARHGAAHHDIRLFFHVADHLGILFREHLGLNGKGKRHQDDSAERFENPVHRLILLRWF